jgi:hypothetical protein
VPRVDARATNYNGPISKYGRAAAILFRDNRQEAACPRRIAHDLAFSPEDAFGGKARGKIATPPKIVGPLTERSSIRSTFNSVIAERLFAAVSRIGFNIAGSLC